MVCIDLAKMSREHKKLQALVADALDTEYVALWFAETVPDFSEEDERLDNTATFDRKTLYERAVENETMWLIRELSGSATPILKALRTQRWTERVVQALSKHHIYPLRLASDSRSLCIELALVDFPDLHYLKLTYSEVDQVLGRLKAEDKTVGANLLLYIRSEWDFLFPIRRQHNGYRIIKESALVHVLTAACHYGKEDILRELLQFTNPCSPHYKGAMLAAARAGHTNIARRFVEEMLCDHKSIMEVATEILSEQLPHSEAMCVAIWSEVADNIGQRAILDWIVKKSSITLFALAFEHKVLDQALLCRILYQKQEEILSATQEDEQCIFAAFEVHEMYL